MNDTIITAVASVFSAFLAAWFGYYSGRKKTDADASVSQNEAYKSAFDGYNQALANLRAEFEKQVEGLQKQIEDLKKQICITKNCPSRQQ